MVYWKKSSEKERGAKLKFRPCIDIHDGKVKQIVGGSLTNQSAKENFVSVKEAAFYASLYQEDGLKGGHIILLNPKDTAEYKEDTLQAVKALRAYPGGMQIGGGITKENALYFLEQGASHIIVTSYVFKGGRIYYENLEALCSLVGKERLVLDLSCRKSAALEEDEDSYYIVTDRWQKFTEEPLSGSLLGTLSSYCDEFLIHAVDVEGKSAGIERKLANLLGSWGQIPITYAGGVGSFDDMEELRELGKNKLDATIGSSLDIFGGNMKYSDVVRRYK